MRSQCSSAFEQRVVETIETIVLSQRARFEWGRALQTHAPDEEHGPRGLVPLYPRVYPWNSFTILEDQVLARASTSPPVAGSLATIPQLEAAV